MVSKERILELCKEFDILPHPSVIKVLQDFDENTVKKILLEAKKKSVFVLTLEDINIKKLQIKVKVTKVDHKKKIESIQIKKETKKTKVIKLTEFLKVSNVAKTEKIKEEVKVENKITIKEKIETKEKPKVEKEVKQEVIVNYTSPRLKPIESETSVEVIKEITAKGKKWKPADFVEYYKYKLNFYKKLLKSRVNPISIKNIINLNPDQEVGLIGRVFELIKRDNYATLILEDTTEQVTVKIFKDTPAWEKVKYLVPDDIIGIKGIIGRKADVIAKEIIFPDIPSQQIKKAPEEVYAVFITDIHVGSKYFLENNFKKFLEWLNLKRDNGLEIARKVKYLIVTGDLVDGVGIYPEQEKELLINDIGQQYEYFAKLMEENLNREDIKVILIPGNHDAVRLEEPQPPLPKDLAKHLYELGFYILPNPSWVRIHRKDNFEGFNLLLYHGYVFDWLVANVDALREGYLKPQEIMKFLLLKRQIFAGHGSNPYVPQTPDPLLIDIIPDFFVTGHIHRTGIGDYKGVTLLNAGCWQETTPFQKKVGHVPEPGKAIAINLKTRDKIVLNFYK